MENMPVRVRINMPLTFVICVGNPYDNAHNAS
jgi:hypothetical protein